MRVIAGTARRLLLKTPEGKDTRPTTDRIKETLFNMLMPYLSGAIFVDLFSGSGGIGIEALSRGAAKAYFVENNQKAIACITDNIKHTHFEDKSVILKQDVYAAIRGSIKDIADVIFLDPPYNQEYEKRVLEISRTLFYYCHLEIFLDLSLILLEKASFLAFNKRFRPSRFLV